MTKGESQRAGRGRQPRSETLWNAAAVAGLLLVGVLLGGVAGVVLDRQGLLGRAPQGQQVTVAVPQTPAAPPPAAAPAPRVIAAAPAVDREQLEAQYHESLHHESLRREEGEPATDEAPHVAAPPALPRILPLPEGAPRWQRYAVSVAPAEGRPMIAIVLDDVGVNRRGARKAIALPAPLTLAFMTYANDLADMTGAARAAGHELMLHVPMQPMSETIDPGPNVLRDDLPPAELRQRLAWGLDRFEGYVGINNHMGSRFTASPEGMALVMDELKARGLLFLDSLTAGDSVAARQAGLSGVPFAVRDVFLDNEPDSPAAIRRQLAILEQIARERGYAIGIGHPHDGTVAALAQWIPEMRARGFQLVPVSAVVSRRQQIAAQQAAGG
jgi:polysaccharide deacetylase 2 family uncharacterized protein YibQ